MVDHAKIKAVLDGDGELYAIVGRDGDGWKFIEDGDELFPWKPYASLEDAQVSLSRHSTVDGDKIVKCLHVGGGQLGAIEWLDPDGNWKPW